jgi:hypothetical protein
VVESLSLWLLSWDTPFFVSFPYLWRYRFPFPDGGDDTLSIKRVGEVGIFDALCSMSLPSHQDLIPEISFVEGEVGRLTVFPGVAWLTLNWRLLIEILR